MTRSTRIWLITGMLAFVGAGVSLWLWFATHQPWLKSIVILLGAIGGISAINVLRWNLSERSKTSSNSKDSLYTVLRLGIFALATVLLLGILASFWVAYIQVHSMLYPSRNLRYTPPQIHGINQYEEVQFPTSDGFMLEGWYLPTQNGAVVMLIHGYGGNRSSLLNDAALLAQEGFGVLLYDNRNSGRSQGTITTFGLTEVGDVHGALAFVNTLPGVNPERIGVLGHSMGGAISIMAAAQIPEIKAVVTQSTFTSLEENLQTLISLPPVPFAPMMSFWGKRATGFGLSDARPIDSVATISPRPLLIVHGKQDTTLPAENAYRLYEAAGEPKDLYILTAAGHCCLSEIGGQDYARKVVTFFQESLLK